MSKKKNKNLIIPLAGGLLAAAVLMCSLLNKGLDIGTDRQFVWNSAIIDIEKTDAVLTQHSPVRQKVALRRDKRWEGRALDSFSVMETDSGFVMYYSTYDTRDDVKICAAVSKDGISWAKPVLNRVEYGENTSNNIVFDKNSGITGFFVFRDSNKNAEAGRQYKAVAVNSDGSMTGYSSADGFSWRQVSSLGKVAAVNSGAAAVSAFWSEAENRYFCYFVSDDSRQKIMKLESKNFEKWSKAKAVSFDAATTLHTANIMPYYRSSDMVIGLPLRVTEISTEDATRNFDADSSRLTDTVFAFSTDGDKFHLSQEAWLTPGPQTAYNWNFGDSMVANGILETESIHYDRGQDKELSVYAAENITGGADTILSRYTLRTDGFSSYKAPYNTRKVVTQPLKFGGDRMTVNFSTSTGGYLYVRVVDKNGKPFDDVIYTAEDGTQYGVPQYTSYKMIGDRVDREVVFNGDLSKLKGKTVVLEFYLSDADLYSFGFDNEEYTTDSRWTPENIEMRRFDELGYTDTALPLAIGTDRQLFMDDYIVDSTKTDAVLTAHSPVRKEKLFETGLPWEGDNCDFYVIVDDVDSEGKDYYRMYYLGWDSTNFTDIRVCYAYSYDGSNWIKPNLGLHSFTDKETGVTYTRTNIMLYTEEEIFDNFFVMKDTRPGVPDSERYKAICQGRLDRQGNPSYGLWAWISSDGLRWRKVHRVLPQLEHWFGSFDSVNSLVWDEGSQQFFTYYRVRENQNVKGEDWVDFRKIYGATSPQFSPNHTDTIFELNYGENSPLFEMYTNNIFKYYRAPQLFVGMPTRFSRNFVWQKNYEYLSDPATRLENYNSGQITRTLSMTDTLFITSRDGYNWTRQSEAFITPGPEYQANWIYGNCYPAYGVIETASDDPAEDNQMSVYLFEGKFYKEPSVLYRYTMRLDGFRSYKGGYDGRKITTKSVTFTGDEMLVNFKTSAAGSLEINILDENGQPIDGYTSGRLIGDNTDRKVIFGKDLSQLNGTNVVIEFVLKDAEIYSFKFQ